VRRFERAEKAERAETAERRDNVKGDHGASRHAVLLSEAKEP
jgi:hypothetical protein